MTDRPPPKRDVFMELIQGESMFLHLDARSLAVVVPLGFKSRPQLVLQLGLNMPNPIPDLRGDDWGVTATLSFNMQPFTCRIPWLAVYAMVSADGRGMVWPTDVPDEVAATMGIKKEKPAEAAPAPKEKKKRASKKKEKLPENVVSLKDRAHPPAEAEVPQAPIEAGVAEQLSPQPSPPPSPKKKKAAAQNPKTKRELPSYLRVVK